MTEIITGKKVLKSALTGVVYLVTKWKELDDSQSLFKNTYTIEALEKRKLEPDEYINCLQCGKYLLIDNTTHKCYMLANLGRK